MSSEKIVLTINNEKVPISKCKKLNKYYYKIGNPEIENSGDCYFIDNKYYRQETGLIIFNHSVKKYTMRNKNIIKGVVEVINNMVIFGEFEFDPSLPLIMLSDSSTHHILNYDSLLDNNEYKEYLGDGNFYHISKLTAKQFNLISIPKQEYKYSLPYDSKGITKEYLNIYEKNYNGEISDNVKNYVSVLKDLSFGLEFETTKGFIPSRILNKTGLIPLRDGSISGIEYVTVPLQGEKGLQTVIDLLKPLEERTIFDNSCSLHLHLGNVPRTKEFILTFFKFTCSIQDELFSMFPIYKKYNFRIKNKNYSAPYPTYKLLSRMDPVINSNNIDQNFDVLYQFLSEGQSFEEVGCDLDNISAHPRDPEGTQKWNVHTRYFIHNLIPLIFGNKTTVEFRIHTPTYDVNKIIPFILLNAIMVNYVMINQKNILENKLFLSNRNIYNIIDEYLRIIKLNDGGLLKDSLYDYLEVRKRSTELQNQNGIVMGDESKIRSSTYINWKKKDQNVSELLRGMLKSNPINKTPTKRQSITQKIKDLESSIYNTSISGNIENIEDLAIATLNDL